MKKINKNILSGLYESVLLCMICIEDYDGLGLQAASLRVAEQYIQAFSQIAKKVKSQI